MTIRWQFILPVLVLLIVAQAVVGITSYTQSNEAVEIAVTQQIEQAVSGIDNTASGWFADRKLDVAGWSKESSFQKAFLDTFVGKTARRGAGKALTNIRDAYGSYRSLSLISVDGEVIASTSEDLMGQTVDLDRPHFQTALAGETGISDALPSTTDGRPVVYLTSAITDAKKPEVTRGFLKAVIDLEVFAGRFTDPIRIGETGRVKLFNSSGQLIISPDRSLAFNRDLTSFVGEVSGSAEALTAVEYMDGGSKRFGLRQTMPDTGWTILIDADYAEIEAPSRQVGAMTLLITAVTLLVAGAALYVLAGRITGPIGKLTSVMEHLSGGDLDVGIPGTGRRDELGVMAKTVEVFRENALEKRRLETENAENARSAEAEKRTMMNNLASEFTTTIGSVVDSVSSASEQIDRSASRMLDAAGETSRQTETASAASEQTTADVQTVASAGEELSSSISEISRQVQEASNVASSATRQASETNERIRGLADAAERIGDVIRLINDIADKTNLLALNATIEAARAGDAGKGFAVVASEVKSLAGQTAQATDEISQHIEGIQDSTKNAVDSIRIVTDTINTVDSIASSIATAVEQQSATTREIARTVDQAADRTREVHQSISSVSDASTDSGSAAREMQESSQALSEQSGILRSEVENFIQKIRAA